MQLQFCTYFAYKFATRICTQIADILPRNGLPPKLQKTLQTFLAQGKQTDGMCWDQMGLYVLCASVQ